VKWYEKQYQITLDTKLIVCYSKQYSLREAERNSAAPILWSIAIEIDHEDNWEWQSSDD
jgi:hypothetical protein